MIESLTCPKCGAATSGGGLQGLCGRCLAELALGAPIPPRAAGAAPLSAEQASRPAPATQTGVRTFGDYELLKEIARGGMGVVYKARQVSLNRIVAVKMLLSGEFSGESGVRRFRAEAEAVAHLRHPNIVAIHEIGEQNGQPFFSMDYIEGRNLSALAAGHPLAPSRAAEYLRKISQAIQYAHENGILHRDLKPSNVLVDADDEPRVTDFGLAKRLDGPEPGTQESELTRTGQVLGSPGYLPPEQATGKRGASGPHSDVYSLGAILYHLLTGRPPFAGESLQDTLNQVIRSEPAAPHLLNPAVPRDLEAICLKCLEKNPRQRYPSAGAVADELGRFLRREPIQARPPGAAEKIRHWCRRKPLPAASLGLLFVAAAGSTATALHLAKLNRMVQRDVYLADVNQAHYDWQAGNYAQAFHSLRQHVPHGATPELRGFEWRHLWKLSRGNYSFKLPLHNQVVGSLMFSPDGRALAVFTWDKTDTLRIWDLNTKRERFRIPDAASFGGFSANGKWLVAGGADGTVRVLDAETGKLMFPIPRIGDIVAFGPDGNSVVALDTNRVVVVLKLESQRAIPIATNIVRRYFDYGKGGPLALSPDGRWLAIIRPGGPSDREDSGVEIWDASNQTRQATLTVRREIRTLQFSPDNQWLAIGDGDGWIHLWNRTAQQSREFQADETPILSLAFSPDSRTLATGSSGENIQLWDLPTLGQKLKKFDGQIGAVWSLAFSPDGKFLASGGRDSPVKFWALDDPEPLDAVTGLQSDKIGNFTFSPDGSLMAGGCRDNSVRIWEVASLKELYRLPGASYVVAFTRDGSKLLAATAAGVAHWWDFRANTQRSVPEYAGFGQLTSVALSVDGRVAAVGRSDGAVQLLEIDSGKVLGTYRGHTDAVLSISFAPGARIFATGSRDKAIRIWDAQVPGKSLQICAEHKGAVGGLAISGDGRMMVSGCSANTIKFWDLRHLSQSSVSSISWHQSAIRTLAFSPDLRILASGSEDKTVKLWEIASRRQLASYNFDAAIRMVAFSADANNLAVVLDNGTVHLLRTVTLADADEEIRTFYASQPR